MALTPSDSVPPTLLQDARNVLADCNEDKLRHVLSYIAVSLHTQSMQQCMIYVREHMGIALNVAIVDVVCKHRNYFGLGLQRSYDNEGYVCQDSPLMAVGMSHALNFYKVADIVNYVKRSVAKDVVDELCTASALAYRQIDKRMLRAAFFNTPELRKFKLRRRLSLLSRHTVTHTVTPRPSCLSLMLFVMSVLCVVFIICAIYAKVFNTTLMAPVIAWFWNDPIVKYFQDLYRYARMIK